MLPQRFDQARPFVTLGIVLLAWLLVPTVFKRLLRVSFYEFQAPAEVAASHIRDVQTFWSMKTRSRNELIEAGRDLVQLNNAHEIKARENATLRGEISRLEHLLRLPSYQGYRSEPARVARRDFSNWWQRLVVRKGSNHGITVGAPVIFVGGVVGRVVEVHAYTSVVELISSPGVRLAAVFESDARPVSYQGGVNTPFRSAHGTIEYVPLDLLANSAAPRRLITAGLGGVFPAGLSIGRVVQLEPGPDGLFKSGRVALDPRLNQLTEVTVLVPIDPGATAR